MEIPFGAANREKHFEDIGAALNAGDLTGARRALLALHQTFALMNVNRHDVPSPSPAVPAKIPTPSPEQANRVSVIA